ncbi:MAG: YbaB/EbfC family nucleoid-associated protein [Vulcanococcus sp.]
MAGFALPNFGQLTEAFKKAQQIQEDAAQLQQELDMMEIEGQSSCGRSKIWLSGNQKPIRVKIESSLLNEDAEVIEAIMLEALQSAYANSTLTMKKCMEKLTSGLSLPGF